MGIGSWLKDVGDGIASGTEAVASAANVVDRYINPFHGELQSLPEDRRDESKDTALGNYVNHQVETAAQGLNWLYSNGVSQPISTVFLQAKVAGERGNPGNYLSASAWSRAWHAANYISPGQAAMLDNPLGMTSQTPVSKGGPAQAQPAIDSQPLYYSPAASALPAGWDQLSQDQQQQILKDAGMPAVGNRYIANLRAESNLFKYGSGTLDFGVRWWLDPAILGGKALGAARRESQVVRRPTEGWSGEDINKLMDKSLMGRAQDYIYANRANPQLLNNLSMARNSALGPRFGAIASLLKSPEEVNDFLRVGLGDINAMERLQTKNALAASRIQQDTERFSALGLMRTRYANLGNEQMSKLVEQHMDDLTTRINADDALVNRYNQVLGHANELDELNLSRWSFSRAEQQTEAQNAYLARTARKGAARERGFTPGMPVLSAGAQPGGAGLLGGRVGTAAYASGSPISGGFVKSRIYGVGDFFSAPVTLVRAVKEMRPNGYMRVDDLDKDSIVELRAQLARIPAIKAETKATILNQYLQTTTEGERVALLNDVGRIGAAKVAEKHGLDGKQGLEIFQEQMKRKLGEVDNMKRYSAAWKEGEKGTAAEGTKVRVDEFTDEGGKLVTAPNLVTRLANDHVFQDLAELDKVLARHASPLRALREHPLGNADWMLDGADYMTSLFKFATLFRLGYIPRVAGDDVAGQWARAGSAAMAMRIKWGVQNGATNLAMWQAKPFLAAVQATKLEGVKYAESELARLKDDITPLRAQVSGRRASNAVDLERAQARYDKAQVRHEARPTPATQALVDKHGDALALASRRASIGAPGKNIRLQSLEQQAGHLERFRDLSRRAADDAAEKQKKSFQGSHPVEISPGVFAPASLAGSKQAEMYAKLISPDEALGQIFQTNKQLMHGNLQRSFDHGGKVIRATDDEALHATSWAHAINNQLAQDALAVQAIKGASADDMSQWLQRTAEGRAYRKRLGLRFTSADELANSAFHDVADYLPSPLIREKALEGKVTPAFLQEEVPNLAHRPEVHTGQVGQSQLKYKRALDRVISSWFNVAATIPAKSLSRHPLFNQLYEGHLGILKNQLVKQGAFDTTVDAVEQLATAARRLAHKDMRKLVFDIAHRSDAASALRFISPFMSATTESFQRWGRIIAEKPQVVGYAANFFNAPLSMGVMQDAEGNHIMQDGTIMDPVTGKRTLVPKSQRYIVARMPHWLVDSPVGVALGVERSSGNMKLSQNSMNIVTQGDPWFHPGVGPIVQIPINELVKDKPKQAELARALGILPFGPQQGGTGGPLNRATGFMIPATMKNFLTAFDTSDERYQSVKLQITQRAAYEHKELGKPMPTAQQISGMVRDYWLFSAASAFLQPMSTQRKDAYQFYRDQYNNLRRADPRTADDEFLAKFHESYFTFAQSQSQNASGLPASMKAVELSKKFAGLIAQHPDLAVLIVGPEGNGPFSPEAYSYQLNTPLVPGGAEMQRTKMSADQAMEENKKRLGWAKYTAKMNDLTAQLTNRGLASFEDKGAADLKDQKRQYTMLYSQPLYPDGSPNPFYNDAWSRDFSSFDNLKYDRLVAGLQAVASSPLADQSKRSDLRVLQQYLGGRKQLVGLLAERGAAKNGAKTLSSARNADLASQWARFVDGLVESDTSFGDLYHRYLSRDLGVTAVPADQGAA